MFPSTDITFLTSDWIIQTGPPLCKIYILNLGELASEFQALQLVLACRAVDEPLSLCMVVHFRVFVFQK